MAPHNDIKILNNMTQKEESIIENMHIEIDQKHQILTIIEDLRLGRKVTNIRFDRMFPTIIKKLSTVHWTPVEVARKAAELLDTNATSKVLDIGSGCGKFCIIAALTRPGSYFGIEQRSYLSEIAKEVATDFSLKNVTFIEGNMINLDWTQFDCFYLYNPFFENRMLPFGQIDNEIPANEIRYELYTETVCSKLAQLKTGTKVVTYHGFGSEFPESYELKQKEFVGTDYLELWIKTK